MAFRRPHAIQSQHMNEQTVVHPDNIIQQEKEMELSSPERHGRSLNEYH